MPLARMRSQHLSDQRKVFFQKIFTIFFHLYFGPQNWIRHHPWFTTQPHYYCRQPEFVRQRSEYYMILQWDAIVNGVSSLIHSPVDGHQAQCQDLAIMNHASVNILVRVSCYTCARFSWSGIVGLSGTECSILQENYQLFSKLAVSIYPPTSNVQEVLSSHVLCNTWRLLNLCQQSVCKWYFIMVFIYISLITKENKALIALLFTGVSFS